MSDDPKLVCCNFRCAWLGLRSEALTAPDPFNDRCELIACPDCRDQTLVSACDEAGCKDSVSCGTPTPSGYRNTCYKHKPKE